ncbi:hypothetical protein J8L88_16890 [Aquimarina sp. MMG015]|uniref:hypothetical protein n=1 Tax=Aquimarina sp. MMG015 TaxID=2822689 RepID=UPI001B39D0A6|nr:hypothetical protein [Aquimarina sp. MMG015]MBQ4804540.1 hypothetical protein [Aquimarina sp. MMG015]
MKRTHKILSSILLVIIGWLMIGVGFTMKMGHPVNTFLLLFGILAFIVGAIWFIICIKR